MTALSGKTALVTGASRGIGRASALALAKAGAQAEYSGRLARNLGQGTFRPTRDDESHYVPLLAHARVLVA